VGEGGEDAVTLSAEEFPAVADWLGEGDCVAIAGSTGIATSDSSGEGVGDAAGSLVTVVVSEAEEIGAAFSSAITGATMVNKSPTREKARKVFTRTFGFCAWR